MVRPGVRAMLAAAPICLGAAAHAADYPRLLTGEEIQLQQQSEQWETQADLADGLRFRVTFLPDGAMAATNVKGGGSLVGRWTVQVSEHRLCIQWQAPDWPPSGCYRMVATSQTGYDLIDPDTQKRVWRFKILNY